MDFAEANYVERAIAARRLADWCRVRFPWYLPDQVAAPAAQASLFERASAAPVKFHSGSTAYWDLRGCVLAGAPVGITATAVGRGSADKVLGLARDYASRGGQVFVDSGAFGAFVAGRQLDFAVDVFPVYEQLLDGCAAPVNLHLVMPDVVGDPEASRVLQLQHAERLRRWMRAGARCIFPLHSPVDAQFLQAIERVADGLPFTIGVPSNLEAWSLPELTRFCASQRPNNIHLLGMGSEKSVQAVADALSVVTPATVISCDSCTWLAHVGAGRRLTDRARTRLRAAVRWVMANTRDTDVPFPPLSIYRTHALWTPNYLDERTLPGIAQHFGVDPQQLLDAARTQGLLQVLGPLDPDEEWMEDRLDAYLREHVYGPELERVLRGPIRAYEVARLVGFTEPNALDHNASRAHIRRLQGS